MTEDDFDPFADNEHGPHNKPRVNMTYVSETAASKKSLRKPLLSRLPGLNINRDHLVFTGKAMLVAAIMFAYPVMTVMAHQINDDPIVVDDSRFWAVPDIGVTSVLIARELDGPGWASDRHPWHPQARLTALPVWQETMLAALADHGRLIISQLEDLRDQDLIAAVRLLEPADGLDVTARLMAANEGLLRYDDRVAGGVAVAPRGAAAILAKLTMTNRWIDQKHTKLADIASPGDGWIASQEAIEAVYAAKAIAHVGHEMLAASARQESKLIADRGADALMQDALTKWRHAAAMEPLFVANQSEKALSGVNHPAIMAFYLDQARRANLALIAHLEITPAPSGPSASEDLAQLGSN